MIKVLNLGCLDYRRTLRIQHHLAARIRADREQEEPPTNVLILVEHPPVYTTGIRTKAGTHSYLSKIIIK